MKNKINVIVFDLGNVLLPFDYYKIVLALNKIDSGLGNRFYNRYFENYNVHRDYETYKLTDNEFIKTMKEWTENKISDKSIKQIYSNLFSENKDTTSLLPKLKENYQLVLLSNTNFIHQKYGWMKYNFIKHFDKLILSHEIGFAKPDKEIYSAVEAFTEEPPESHLFIDDIYEYVKSAKKNGWHGVQFTTHKKLLSDFELHNIII